MANGMVDNRLHKIETEIIEFRKSNTEVGSAIASIAKSVEIMSETQREIKNGFDSFKRFEARQEEARRNDDFNRSRMDNRIDALSKDLVMSRKEVDQDFTRLYNRARADKEELKSQINDLSTKIEVSNASRVAGKENTKDFRDYLKDDSNKIWKWLFFIGMSLVAFSVPWK